MRVLVIFCISSFILGCGDNQSESRSVAESFNESEANQQFADDPASVETPAFELNAANIANTQRAFAAIDVSPRDGLISPKEAENAWSKFKKSFGSNNSTFDFNRSGAVTILDFSFFNAVLADNLSARELRRFTVYQSIEQNNDGRFNQAEQNALSAAFRAAFGKTSRSSDWNRHKKFDDNNSGGITIQDFSGLSRLIQDHR